MKEVNILDFPIASVTMQEAIDWVEEKIKNEEFAHIVTLNPEIAYTGYKDDQFSQALKQADLRVADGNGILWAASYLNNKLPERVAGFDLMQEMLGLAAKNEYKVYFLGAAPQVAERAAQAALEKYPGFVLSGCHDGYFDQEEEVKMLAEIARLRPNMLFCALGPPRPAEQWIQKNKEVLGPLVAMGVGGSFNVLAGLDKRAPDWVIKIRLEWLYRALRDPKRFKRLLAIPKFMWAVRGQKNSSGV